jgi:hypothetical protein
VVVARTLEPVVATALAAACLRALVDARSDMATEGVGDHSLGHFCSSASDNFEGRSTRGWCDLSWPVCLYISLASFCSCSSPVFSHLCRPPPVPRRHH